jgi:hypothetical protein
MFFRIVFISILLLHLFGLSSYLIKGLDWALIFEGFPAFFLYAFPVKYGNFGFITMYIIMLLLYCYASFRPRLYLSLIGTSVFIGSTILGYVLLK